MPLSRHDAFRRVVLLGLFTITPLAIAADTPAAPPTHQGMYLCAAMTESYFQGNGGRHPDWTFMGGIRFRGIPAELEPMTRPIAPGKDQPKRKPELVPVLAQGLVPEGKDEERSQTILAILLDRGWTFNATDAIAPDGTHHLLLPASALGQLGRLYDLDVKRSRIPDVNATTRHRIFIEWPNSLLVGGNMQRLREKLPKIVEHIASSYHFQRTSDVRIVIGRQASRDYALDPESYTNVININVLDAIEGRGPEVVTRLLIERALLRTQIYAPQAESVLRATGEKPVIDGRSSMATLMAEREKMLVRARSGERDATVHFVHEHFWRLRMQGVESPSAYAIGEHLKTLGIKKSETEKAIDFLDENDRNWRREHDRNLQL